MYPLHIQKIRLQLLKNSNLILFLRRLKYLLIVFAEIHSLHYAECIESLVVSIYTKVSVFAIKCYVLYNFSKLI